MVPVILHLPENFAGGLFLLAVENGSLILAADRVVTRTELVQRYKLQHRIGGGYLDYKNNQLIFSRSCMNYGGITTPHMRELCAIAEDALRARFPGTTLVPATESCYESDHDRVQGYINQLLHPIVQ